jgi:YD repeat-containing protein
VKCDKSQGWNRSEQAADLTNAAELECFNSQTDPYNPDELNRVKERRIWANGFVIDLSVYYDYSKEDYGYDQMNRVITTDRTLQTAGGTGEIKRDSFGYNPRGELTSAVYGQVPDGQGGFIYPERSVGYDLDFAGNRNSVTDSTKMGGISYGPNNLNEYSITSNNPEHEVSYYYDQGQRGVSYNYLGDTHLATVTAGTDTYQIGYDALGRCVRRTMNDQTTYYIYDADKTILEIPDGDVAVAPSTILYGIGPDEIIGHGNNGVPQWLMQGPAGKCECDARWTRASDRAIPLRRLWDADLPQPWR